MAEKKKTGTIKPLKTVASKTNFSMDSLVNSVKNDIEQSMALRDEQMSVPVLTRRILMSPVMEYKTFFNLPPQFNSNITVKEYILASLLANGTRTGSFSDIEKIAKFMGEGFTSDNEDNGVLTNLVEYMQEIKEKREA